ncbi:hypothetical protein BDD12DRAFT_333821 [Trichophaea hybrida]|nr:hypothetical protein BDD12DRAFT_333821 [Trichophaea hybrida]
MGRMAYATQVSAQNCIMHPTYPPHPYQARHAHLHPVNQPAAFQLRAAAAVDTPLTASATLQPPSSSRIFSSQKLKALQPQPTPLHQHAYSSSNHHTHANFATPPSTTCRPNRGWRSLARAGSRLNHHLRTPSRVCNTPTRRKTHTRRSTRSQGPGKSYSQYPSEPRRPRSPTGSRYPLGGIS